MKGLWISRLDIVEWDIVSYVHMTLKMVRSFIDVMVGVMDGIENLIGNLLVSLLVGLVFIFSEISMYNIINFSVLPFLFAFLVTFIREIIKDLEDIVGDKANSIRTFPVVFGEKNTIILSIYLMFLLNIIVLIPYLFSFYNLNYLLAVIIGVILPNSYCIIYFIKKRFQYNYKNIQNIQKIITIMGLFIIYFMKNNF